MIIREPSERDEEMWRQLWAGYIAFSEASVSDRATNRTWQRILDPTSPVFARLAEENGEVIGFTVSVLHEGTWAVDPICYLEDLFVNPRNRGAGAGRRLVQDVVSIARERGCSRVYWHTRSDNPARRLYDEFVEADAFVRYRLILTE